jgi:hypothetical protein
MENFGGAEKSADNSGTNGNHFFAPGDEINLRHQRSG